MPKKKPEKIDGLSPDDIKKVRSAIRQVWSWSHPRRLCVKRATQPDGFLKCENCDSIVPKIHVDHINPVGELSDGFLERLFCSSHRLQALCNECHKVKTRFERKAKS